MWIELFCFIYTYKWICSALSPISVRAFSNSNCFLHLKISHSSQPCQQHLQHMGQRALQDVWWWCVPVPWYVWIQPGLRLPRVLPGVLSAREEGSEWWKPYSELCGGHHQWPFIPPHQEPGHRESPSVSKKPYSLWKYFSFLWYLCIMIKKTFSVSQC